MVVSIPFYKSQYILIIGEFPGENKNNELKSQKVCELGSKSFKIVKQSIKIIKTTSFIKQKLKVIELFFSFLF